MAATGVAVMLTATPASADQRCNTTRISNVCLTIQHGGNSIYDVTLGIDVHMSRADAQEIINAPGDPFTGTVYGADDGEEALFTIDITNLVATDEFGLSGEGFVTVGGSLLNEDRDGRDEVFGRIVLVDSRTGRERTFNTPEISRNF